MIKTILNHPRYPKAKVLKKLDSPIFHDAIIWLKNKFLFILQSCCCFFSTGPWGRKSSSLRIRNFVAPGPGAWATRSRWGWLAQLHGTRRKMWWKAVFLVGWCIMSLKSHKKARTEAKTSGFKLENLNGFWFHITGFIFFHYSISSKISGTENCNHRSCGGYDFETGFHYVGLQAAKSWCVRGRSQLKVVYPYLKKKKKGI